MSDAPATNDNQNKRARFSPTQDKPPQRVPAVIESPSAKGLSTIHDKLASLSAPDDFKSLIEADASKMLRLAIEFDSKQDALRRFDKDDYIPASARLKFEIRGSDSVKSSETFNKLVDEAKAAVDRIKNELRGYTKRAASEEANMAKKLALLHFCSTAATSFALPYILQAKPDLQVNDSHCTALALSLADDSTFTDPTLGRTKDLIYTTIVETLKKDNIAISTTQVNNSTRVLFDDTTENDIASLKQPFKTFIHNFLILPIINYRLTRQTIENTRKVAAAAAEISKSRATAAAATVSEMDIEKNQSLTEETVASMIETILDKRDSKKQSKNTRGAPSPTNRGNNHTDNSAPSKNKSRSKKKQNNNDDGQNPNSNKQNQRNNNPGRNNNNNNHQKRNNSNTNRGRNNSSSNNRNPNRRRSPSQNRNDETAANNNGSQDGWQTVNRSGGRSKSREKNKSSRNASNRQSPRRNRKSN